ncbi:MAG TPA: hypothetical protein VMF91_05050 [Bryobacteraceae bacterium]|nr:hypothetical protein [Bryobacteraceae bacterium]
MATPTDTDPPIPFSARNRLDTTPIDDDFPESARVGLLHLVRECEERRIISSWRAVLTELQRIARYSPSASNNDATNKLNVEALLSVISWERAYDFCERIHNYLCHGVEYETDEGVVAISKNEAKQFVADEMQRLFQEENLAFEFRHGIVLRRGRRHTVDRISKAEAVLADTRLDAARKHFAKAIRYFRDRIKPDPENAVKEAVCAVEAAAKELFPNAKAATLDQVIKWLAGSEPGKLPKAIGQTFTGLYGFRGSGEGVAHGGSTGGAATNNIAEYAIALAASQIILLADLAKVEEDEVPF